MLIKDNGIEIDVQNGYNASIVQIVKQTPEATRIVRHYKNIIDNETGLSICTNKFPFFSKQRKRLYLRGIDKAKDNHQVQIPTKIISFDNLVRGLKNVLAEVVVEGQVDIRNANDFVQANREHVTLDGKKVVGANTTLVRMAFINNEMAMKLRLTSRKDYPQEIIDWQPLPPIHTPNRHYNEHIGQIVDVLNKSKNNREFGDHVVNEENVTIPAAKWAVNKLRELFAEANQKDKYHLIALWRTITGFRGPDFK